MKIYFQKDYNVTAIQEDLIKNLLVSGSIDSCSISGNIKIEEIDFEELEYYDDEEDQEFIKEYSDHCDIYNVYCIVAGNWEQPISLIAVDWDNDDE